ncbi:hypothetical protein L208DRAFT_1381807 [Tricholoma matsutake]|nr:hypothetical protein L208DRAFT_1381807 [Tricholoma matsutake 945]
MTVAQNLTPTWMKRVMKKSDLEEEVLANIKRLGERWQCSVADGSDFCYWTQEEPKHYPLHHKHFWAWAQALLKHDDSIATVEQPPNHEVFQGLSLSTWTKGSPLLEHQL